MLPEEMHAAEEKLDLSQLYQEDPSKKEAEERKA